MKNDELIDRCPTGIKGFDNICQGRFVRNSVHTLLGGPGAGKTIFLLQFLYNGATEFNENGMYISFEPDPVEVYKDGFMFGWDFQKLDGQGKVKFMRISPLTSVSELKQ